jgi:hypothetical protein
MQRPSKSAMTLWRQRQLIAKADKPDEQLRLDRHAPNALQDCTRMHLVTEWESPHDLLCSIVDTWGQQGN